MPYYSPSPQYKSVSTSDDEAEQISAAKGKYTDPTLTPIPRDEHASMEQEEAGKEEDSPGYSTPPEAVGMTTHNNIQPCPTSWTEPYKRYWINQAPPA